MVVGSDIPQHLVEAIDRRVAANIAANASATVTVKRTFSSPEEAKKFVADAIPVKPATRSSVIREIIEDHFNNSNS